MDYQDLLKTRDGFLLKKPQLLPETKKSHYIVLNNKLYVENEEGNFILWSEDVFRKNAIIEPLKFWQLEHPKVSDIEIRDLYTRNAGLNITNAISVISDLIKLRNAFESILYII